MNKALLYNTMEEILPEGIFLQYLYKLSQEGGQRGEKR